MDVVAEIQTVYGGMYIIETFRAFLPHCDAMLNRVVDRPISTTTSRTRLRSGRSQAQWC